VDRFESDLPVRMSFETHSSSMIEKKKRERKKVRSIFVTSEMPEEPAIQQPDNASDPRDAAPSDNNPSRRHFLQDLPENKKEKNPTGSQSSNEQPSNKERENK
jgi:hypothetical protein